ncbi:MAG: FAD-dependent oxidoreductase [Deltaproteobacteria bacterium]|nr:FAD-dependent oxidoreductase [Deltaproteobacteria bacterium]
MKEYDVIVVGAGPAGCAAARAASRQGARIIMIEEHPVIGAPRHCPGRLHSSSFTREILEDLDPRVIVCEYSSRRYFAPSGKVIKETALPPGSVFQVQRDEFDRELARQAVLAGAEIVLRTRVTGLYKEKDCIRGVTTASDNMPVVHGRVVIVASGTKGRLSGIPKQEGLTQPGETSFGGILVDLVGIRDIEPGVIETYLGEVFEMGINVLWTKNRYSGLMGFMNIKGYHRLVSGDSFAGRKFKDARPVQIFGNMVGSAASVKLERPVKDNLILVGDAAGFTSITHGIVSGRNAGEVAADAVQDGDTGEARLKRYMDKCRDAGLYRSTLSWSPRLVNLRGHSDAEIEAMIPDMLADNEIYYGDVWDF